MLRKNRDPAVRVCANYGVFVSSSGQFRTLGSSDSADWGGYVRQIHTTQELARLASGTVAVSLED